MSASGGGGSLRRVSAVCSNRPNAKACSIKHPVVDALMTPVANSRVGSIGITTYIGRALCGNTPFSPRSQGGSGSRECALRLGRQVDRAFANRVNKHVSHHSPGIALRIRQVIAELGKRGIHCVRAQVLVGMAHKGIKVGVRCRSSFLLCVGKPSLSWLRYVPSLTVWVRRLVVGLL
jgi:hypothetical protein